ncbi:plasmid mobilization protein [Mediterraneibacter agrestimuris]|uniref:plasmid mobilization protein n=1 Tax=Mediterraneibacter agrestimuris TaxID=2941333 RepID=UPI00203F344B|nr:plasmid mobilization relaxosome protein MobC [Mediterraneibacter agrestimuris]
MIDRSYIVGVRLTKQEYRLLTEKAERDCETLYRNGKKNLSGYIRKCALNESGKMTVNLNRELKQLAYQVRKIGVNINQVAKKINAGYGYPDPMSAVEELKVELAKIETQFAELLQVVEENGNYKTPEY